AAGTGVDSRRAHGTRVRFQEAASRSGGTVLHPHEAIAKLTTSNHQSRNVASTPAASEILGNKAFSRSGGSRKAGFGVAAGDPNAVRLVAEIGTFSACCLASERTAKR